MKETERKVKVSRPAGVPWVSSAGSGRHPVTARRKWSKKDNKMAILCCLQAKEGPNIGNRKSMHQYWINYGLLIGE